MDTELVDVAVDFLPGRFDGHPSLAIRSSQGHLLFALDASTIAQLNVEDRGGLSASLGEPMEADRAGCLVGAGPAHVNFTLSGEGDAIVRSSECGVVEDERGPLHLLVIDAFRVCQSAPDSGNVMDWMAWR